MSVSAVILVGLAAYGLLGLGFAVVFVTRGLGRVDPTARHASLSVRLLLVPGAVAVWPIMLRRWLTAMRRGT